MSPPDPRPLGAFTVEYRVIRHDGAQQRLVSVALRLQVWLAAHRDVPADALQDRVAALDRTLSVRSHAHDGTVVRARLPLHQPPGQTAAA